MQSLAHQCSAGCGLTARPALRHCSTTAARPRVAVQAEPNKPQGYVRKDSAGQENVYATEPGQYVKGSARDSGNTQANNAIAGVAAGLAIVAIVAGLIVTGGQQPTNLTDIQAELGEYKTLSEYAQIFSQ